MFNSWDGVMKGAGVAGLSYLAAGKNDKGQVTLRMSLTGDDALLSDVRLLGAVAAGFGAQYKGLNEKTRKGLRGIAEVSAFSLVATEAVRYKLKDELGIKKAPVIPWTGETKWGKKLSYGASNSAHSRPAWAAAQ